MLGPVPNENGVGRIMGMDIKGLRQCGYEVAHAWDSMDNRYLGIVQYGHGILIGIL